MRRFALSTVSYLAMGALALAQPISAGGNQPQTVQPSQLPDAGPPAPGDWVPVDQPNVQSPTGFSSRRQSMTAFGIYPWQRCVGYAYGHYPALPSCNTTIPASAITGLPPSGGSDNLIPNVKADGYFMDDGSINAGSSTFSSPTATCDPVNDPGKIFVSEAIAANGDPVTTTITGCSGNAFQLATSNQSGQNLTGLMWGYGTDDSATIANYIATNPRIHPVLPAGDIVLNSTPIRLDHTWLSGQGFAIMGFGAPSSGRLSKTVQGTKTTFLVTSPTVKPIILHQDQTLEDVGFFWPGQTGRNGSPFPYPRLFSDDGTNAGMSTFNVNRVGVLNAYDTFGQTYSLTPTWSSAPWGFLNIQNSHIASIRYDFDLNLTPEFINMAGTLFNMSAMGYICCTNNKYHYALYNWSLMNGAWWHAVGPGTNQPGANCKAVFGFVAYDNVTVYVKRWLLYVSGATWAESILGVDYGNVMQAMYLDPGSTLNDITVYGLWNMSGDGLNHVIPPQGNAQIDIESDCGGAALNLQSIQFKGVYQNVQGPLFNFAGHSLRNVSVQGVQIMLAAEWASQGVQSSPSYILQANAPNLNLTWGGNTMFLNPSGSTPGPLYAGLKPTLVRSMTIHGNTFDTLYNPIDLSGLTGGTIAIGTNTSVGTPSAQSLVPAPAGVGNVVVAPNAWDKP